MKKLAIFVEGGTEAAFFEKFLHQMISAKKLRIEYFRASGGSKGPRRIRMVKATAPDKNQTFYVQIVDSGTDNRVGSDVRDNYNSLVRAGFDSIIGVRDVFPSVSMKDISVLRRNLRYSLPTKPIVVVFILAVMEVEAWFLSEYTHFPKIHPDLSIDRIKTALGFDPSSDDMQLRNCPHQDLHNVYSLEGLSYLKKARQIERTTDVLDYGRIYFDLPFKFPDLKLLVVSLDAFFS